MVRQSTRLILLLTVLITLGIGLYPVWAQVPATFHQTDFLTAGHFTHTYAGRNASTRTAMRQAMTSRNYTHMYVYAYNEQDYGGPSFDMYDTPSEFRSYLQEIVNAGLKPVVWLFPDDAPNIHGESNSALQARMSALIPVIDDLVDSYCLGLELNEYWDSSKVNTLGTHLNTLTTKRIAVHMTSGGTSYCNFGWCDYFIYQYAKGLSASQIASTTVSVKNAIGKPVVAGEYQTDTTNEPLSISLGNAAVKAGADGFGNGATAITTPPPPPPPTAGVFYASPSGSGSTCSRASPCALSTCVNTANSGGEQCVLLSGTYTVSGPLITLHNGSPGNPIIIQAENRRQPLVKAGSSFNANRTPMLQINHNHIVVRGIRFDGSNRAHWGLRRSEYGLFFRNDILIEDNEFFNISGVGSGISYVDNMTIRYNYYHGTGYRGGTEKCCGSMFYMGSPVGAKPINNLRVYSNRFQDMTDNLMDFKGSNQNSHFHHNIFENHRAVPGQYTTSGNPFGGDGQIRGGAAGAPGNIVENNIFRNNPDANYTIRLEASGYTVRNNTFYNQGGSPFVDSRTNNSNIVSGNVTCAATSNEGKDLGSNSLNQPQSACNAEVARILSPPTVANCSIGSINASTLVVNWSNPVHPPLSIARNGSFSISYDGVAQSELSTTINGTNQTRTTLSAAATQGQTIRLDLAAGAVENSAHIGGLGTDGLNGASLSSNNITCTNSVGGPPDPGTNDEPPYRINAGGPLFTDTTTDCSGSGCPWVADRAYTVGGYGYVGGTVSSGTTSPIAGTTDDTLYQSGRFGTYAYQFTVPNGDYDVTIKFAEVFFSLPGARVFNVSIEGTQVLSNFDIIAEAGANLTAHDEVFTNVTVSDGILNVNTSVVTQSPFINAISVVEAGGGGPPVGDKPILSQTHYRFKNWDGDLNHTNWTCPEDTPCGIAPGGRIRLRLKIAATDADPIAQGYLLQYSDTVDGTYVNVPSGFDAGNVKFSLHETILTSEVIDTEQLTSDYATDIDGGVVQTPVALPILPLVENSEAENEYFIEFDSDATVGRTYFFRLIGDDEKPLTSYVTAMLTIGLDRRVLFGGGTFIGGGRWQ